MMSAKLATPGFLKIKIFWNKGYDIIILDYHVTNKSLSRDSNYTVEFGYSSISITEVIMISILQGFDHKIPFFEGWYWFKFNNLWPAIGMIFLQGKNW